MNRQIIVLLFVLNIPVIYGAILKAQSVVDNTSYVSAADITYDKPVSRSEEGLPIGNGRMGTLVWTVPSVLKFQVNRVDIFGNNTASDNFYVRNTDYCGGAGIVDIDFGDHGRDVFTGDNFKQHLSCSDGMVTTSGNGVSVDALIWNEKDVMAVRVNDRRKEPLSVTASLRMLRMPITNTGNHKAISKTNVLENKIILTQVFEEDDYYCSSAVVIAVSGRDAKPVFHNDMEVKLIAKPGNDQFTIYIASAATFDRKEDVTGMAMKQLEPAMAVGFDDIYRSNVAWWKNFWSKGYVHMHSSDGEADFIEKNYWYYLYVMASSSRGKYPPKFNGMLWSTNGDARKWGNLYWGANQSCLYNALFPTNRMELLDPMFSMYTGMRTSLEIAARQQWGSKGIYIPETVGFNGLPELPENIATEMRDLYLLKKQWNARSDLFNAYASTKMPFLSTWNWKKDIGWKNGKWIFTDKGGGPFGHVTHIFSRGAKIAYQYWQKYEYTHDTVWLKKEAYPMLKGMTEFYFNFPDVRKEADGKYHIYNVNDNESVWGGHNTVEEISSMMGIFSATIRASEILNTDNESRSVWKEFLNNLSSLPLSTSYPEKFSGNVPVTWVKSLASPTHGEGYGRPDPNTMPVWFFDLCNLNCNKPEMIKIANATFDSYFREGINSGTSVYVLSKLPVAGTILGRADVTRYLIPNQIRTSESEVMPNRMDLREGYQTMSVQRLGRAAEALHNALCQSIPPWPGKDPVIHVFPAWPAAWDAQFKLLCRGNFLVTSSFRAGKVEFVEILSQSGTPCSISNPWIGADVLICRDGEKAGRLKGRILNFNTSKNEIIRLTILKN